MSSGSVPCSLTTNEKNKITDYPFWVKNSVGSFYITLSHLILTRALKGKLCSVRRTSRAYRKHPDSIGVAGAFKLRPFSSLALNSLDLLIESLYKR